MLKSYSKKVKDELVLRVKNGGGLSAVCREMKIPVGTGHTWVKKANVQVRKGPAQVRKQLPPPLQTAKTVTVLKEEPLANIVFTDHSNMKQAMTVLIKQCAFYKKQMEYYMELAFQESCK